MVPHVLTEENKQKRVEISKRLLEYLDNGFRNIITGDETWIHFFTVSSKEANKVWLSKEENRPQITRTAQNGCSSQQMGLLQVLWWKKGRRLLPSIMATRFLP